MGLRIGDRELGSVDGQSIPLNPGEHLLVVSHSDHDPQQFSVVLRAGDKDKVVDR